MSDWIVALEAVTRVLAMLPLMVDTVEKAFGGRAGAGAVKRDAVLQLSSSALAAARELGATELDKPGAIDAIQNTVGVATDALVAGLNAAGAFRHVASEDAAAVQG